MIYKTNYLMHHGIKGQKWGEQNGPPYPLNPQKDYSKAEQKANAKQILKGYKKTNNSIVNIKDVDLSDIDKINEYVNNLVGQYGDKPYNKYFTLKERMRVDIQEQLSEVQSDYTEMKCKETLYKNGYKKNDDYNQYEKELRFVNDDESFTVSISNFNTSDVNGLQETINKMSDKKSFNEIYNDVKDKITELAFSPKEKGYMYMDDDDEWNILSESEQKKIFRDKLGTWSWGWDDKKDSANNAVDIVGPNYLSFLIESGGFYGDHALGFEYDMNDKKIMYGFSLEG